MAERDLIHPRRDGGSTTSRISPDPSLAELLKQLANDSGVLVRQEIGLAKAELRDTAKGYASGAGFIAAGALLLVMAALTLTAFLIILLGAILANYWLAALIVGVVFALAGLGLALAGKRRMDRTTVAPEATVRTMQENRDWAQEEIRELRRDLT
jgi:uncharacterized membrane protein YqjE